MGFGFLSINHGVRGQLVAPSAAIFVIFSDFYRQSRLWYAELRFYRHEPRFHATFAIGEISLHHVHLPQDTDLAQDYDINEVIEMALSDHTSFGDIEKLYGLSADDVKRIMRQNLKRGSYEAWRRRVRKFSDRREHYK